jgi:hypothetical protein
MRLHFALFPTCSGFSANTKWKKNYIIYLTEVKMETEIKRQEKIIFKKELQELLSSDFSSEKFQQVLQKFTHLNSESAPLVLAK